MKKRNKTVKKTKDIPLTDDERRYVEECAKAEAVSTTPRLEPATVLEHLIQQVQQYNDDSGVRIAVTEWFYSTPGIGQIVSMAAGNLCLGNHAVAIGYIAGLSQLCLAAVIPGIFSNELSPREVTSLGGDA